MDNLVISNILYRKTRTITTMVGVALGVVLVVLTIGIAHGFLNEQGRRNSAITAEILFGPPGTTFGLSLNPTLSLPIKRDPNAQVKEQFKGIDDLLAIDGVGDAVPVGQYLRGRMIDGIDYDAFTRVSGVRIAEGRAFDSSNMPVDEVIIDRIQQRQRNLKVGEEMEILDRPFRIVGVYEPESLGRIKIPLATLQQYLNREGLCSTILVRVSDPSKQNEVAARIKEHFPDYGVMMTRDLPVVYSQGTPALQTFLNVVIALSIIFSCLIILLTMYTTVAERTRQIGVLKSLGASKLWIAGEIEKEALIISVLGVLAGFALSVAGKFLITRLTTMNVELEAVWLFYALVLGMLAGLLGALYPALRAANQDPVKALAYE
ncbi:MAG TPA: ABC transporter permease [Blastocatellia bacterium]|nr:ABC transporter permease [Blastocatellia bacterium]